MARPKYNRGNQKSAYAVRCGPGFCEYPAIRPQIFLQMKPLLYALAACFLPDSMILYIQLYYFRADCQALFLSMPASFYPNRRRR